MAPVWLNENIPCVNAIASRRLLGSVCDVSLIVPSLSPSRSWDEHESGVAAQEDLEQSQDGQVRHPGSK